MDRRTGMAIGELSRRTGCHIETIRYYERIGLLPTPARRGRYRLYDAEDVWRLIFMRRARELGFTLDEVRGLLRLALRGQDACGEARALAAAHLIEVQAKIADLRAMEDALVEAVQRCGAGETPDCPLIASLSARSASDSPAAAWRIQKPLPSGHGAGSKNHRLPHDLRSPLARAGPQRRARGQSSAPREEPRDAADDAAEVSVKP